MRCTGVSVFLRGVFAPRGPEAHVAETTGDLLQLTLRLRGPSPHDKAIFVRNRGDLATIALEVRVFRVKYC